MLKVFPELREYCQTNGLDFQVSLYISSLHNEIDDIVFFLKLYDYNLLTHFKVVDMRWGVSEEAGNDHMTSILCMDQIKTCQQLSSGPSFVVLCLQIYPSFRFES